MTTDARIEAPVCWLGYTDEQVARIMGSERRLRQFGVWMRGATRALCDGRRWDPAARTYLPSGCGVPHGSITYMVDVQRFLAGLPQDD